MRPRVGVVGLNHGYSLARSISACKGVELAGLCTRDVARHQAKADELGVPLFDDLDSMLGKLSLDGVVIATSTNQLVPIAKRCLAHGVDMLIEKPMAVSVEEAMQLRKAAARTTCKIVIGYYRRLARQVLELERLLAGGVVGDVRGVSCRWVIKKPPGYFRGWKASRAHGGGCLMINVVHDLDMLQVLLGPIETVMAMHSDPEPEGDVEHLVVLSVKFKGGQIGTVMLCDQSPSPYSYENTVSALTKFPQYPEDSHHFFGTRGALAFPSFTLYSSRSPGSSWLDRLDSSVLSHANEMADDPIAAEMERFAQVLRGESLPHATIEDAMRNLAVVEAMRRSLQSARAELVIRG